MKHSRKAGAHSRWSLTHGADVRSSELEDVILKLRFYELIRPLGTTTKCPDRSLFTSWHFRRGRLQATGLFSAHKLAWIPPTRRPWELRLNGCRNEFRWRWTVPDWLHSTQWGARSDHDPDNGPRWRTFTTDKRLLMECNFFFPGPLNETHVTRAWRSLVLILFHPRRRVSANIKLSSWRGWKEDISPPKQGGERSHSAVWPNM